MVSRRTDGHRETPDFVLYTAVLAAYREDPIAIVKQQLGTNLRIFAGRHHLDASVKTAIDPTHYQLVHNLALGHGRILLQLGHWRSALGARVLVTDLNPRSLTAWIFLVCRRVARRRTLVWGHLHPQNGAGSHTAALRRGMRRLSSGTILYGYESRVAANAEIPGSPTWVAPNSLYPRRILDEHLEPTSRDSILYVGRFEPAKKVHLLIRAFLKDDYLRQNFILQLVGHGAELSRLEALAEPAEGRICFAGRTYDANAIRELYSHSAVSVSPGYIGLSLTQSLGFGVPMVISRDEPHSPELELAVAGGVTFFDTNRSEDLAAKLREVVSVPPTEQDRASWIRHVRDLYSAEAMAGGLIAAFRDKREEGS